MSVTPDRLESQVSLLAKRGYGGVTLSETDSGMPTEKRVAFTFDDGYRSVLELAFPILDRFGFRATIFAATDYVGAEKAVDWSRSICRWHGTRHEAELIPLSWAELRQLSAAGWEIASHTCSHPNLSLLSDDRLEHELNESRVRIEHELRVPCVSFCYPFGILDDRVIAAVQSAGYRHACTSERWPDGPLTLPRIRVDHEDSALTMRLKVSPGLRRLRRSSVWKGMSPAWHAVDILRHGFKRF
jgi:peptidoglycan/xylan/chitin deacetylase (PgdA/CDA1 family)